jgi:hypothetical protein
MFSNYSTIEIEIQKVKLAFEHSKFPSLTAAESEFNILYCQLTQTIHGGNSHST